MDSSFREQGSGRQQDPKRSWVSLWIPRSLIKWLADLINLTEEEQEEAGIYLDRRNDEQTLMKYLYPECKHKQSLFQ